MCAITTTERVGTVRRCQNSTSSVLVLKVCKNRTFLAESANETDSAVFRCTENIRHESL